MKKFLLFLFTICMISGFSQNYENFYIDELSSNQYVPFCKSADFSGIVLHGSTNCENNTWLIYNGDEGTEIDNADSILIENPQALYIHFAGCYETYIEYVSFGPANVPDINPFDEPVILKRHSEPITLDATNGYIYTNFDYYWSTGETTPDITIIDPGVYSVTITSQYCGSATYSVEVRDNVELYRATVDLRTNKNKVTWLATPEQAEYITEVKVYRDGTLVGTAPYANGYFLDAIGSDAAARTYQLVGVSVEGDDCPIPSYQKGTIHTVYYQDVNNDLNMTWNVPYVEEDAQGQLTGFEIYKYNPATKELTLIDVVNSSITDYTCNANAFIGGRATVAAIFGSKDSPLGGDGQRPEGRELENRSFSNLSENMAAVGEESETGFKVYPNPSNGSFTVEGASVLAIYNTLGQMVATSQSDNGTHTFRLSPGIYFVKSGEGMVRKVVVE